MTIQDAIKKLEDIAEDTYKIVDGTIYLLDQPFNACDPESGHTWCAHAVMVQSGKISVCGKAYWDFEDFVNELGEIPDDGGEYPWHETPDFSGYSDEMTNDPETIAEIVEEAEGMV